MMDTYQEYIHKSRYARYIPEEQRRENWDETVQRYIKNVVYKAFPNNNLDRPLTTTQPLPF